MEYRFNGVNKNNNSIGNYSSKSGLFRQPVEEDLITLDHISKKDGEILTKRNLGSFTLITEINDNIETIETSNTTGWINYSGTMPISGTLDDPSFELVFEDIDLTSQIYVGMRVRYTQSTVKYGIVTKKAFSTDTTITIYGGTDYDLVSTGTTAVSAFSFSSAKSPAGFPTNPEKWTVEVNNSSNNSQSSPVNGTWYNLGSVNINIPIGSWDVIYQVPLYVERAANGLLAAKVTLSTANNTESNSNYTSEIQSSNGTAMHTTIFRQLFLLLTTKQTYYLNSNVFIASQTAVGNRGDVSPINIKAVSTYL